MSKILSPSQQTLLEKFIHEYSGSTDQEGLRTGKGCEKWQGISFQKYTGNFLKNSIHGRGVYVIENDNERIYYDGLFYANKLEGYGQIIYNDGTSFEGLFKENIRFGPGILSYPDGSQDVGVWNGTSLMRLSAIVEPNMVPRLANTQDGKIKMLQFRNLVSVKSEKTDLAKDILTKLQASENILKNSQQLYNHQVRNPNSLFFNRNLYDENFYGEESSTIEIVLSFKKSEKPVTVKPRMCSDENLLYSDKVSDSFKEICMQLCDVESKLRDLSKYKKCLQLHLERCRLCCHGTEKYDDNDNEEQTLLSSDSMRDHSSNIHGFHCKSDSYHSASKRSSIYSDGRIIYSSSSPSHDSREKFSNSAGKDILHIRSKERHSSTHFAGASTSDSEMKEKWLTRSSENIDGRPSGPGIVIEDLSPKVDNETVIVEEICVCTCEDIENVGVLKSKLEKLVNEEIFYETVQKYLKKKLDKELTKKQTTEYETKKVVVSELLAWNNEKFPIEVMRHCFRNRKSESNITFDVAAILNGKRHCFSSAGNTESGCVTFLEYCIKRTGKEAFDYMTSHHINPDVTDANGNSGIIFAATNDNISAINILVNCGAKIDIVNDEGLTPLVICILRYLALKHEASDWEKSFLGNIILNKGEREILQWNIEDTTINAALQLFREKTARQVEAKISQSLQNVINYLQDVHRSLVNILTPRAQMFSSDQLEVFMERFQKENLTFNAASPVQELDSINQEIWLRGNEKYLLDTDLGNNSKTSIFSGNSKAADKISVAIGVKNKSKTTLSNTKFKYTDEQIAALTLQREQKLIVILSTIFTLLNYGADPNIGEVPLLPLLLSAFTGNQELVLQLLKHGADPNVTTPEDHLNAIHIIASLTPSKENLQICVNLLQGGANPSSKTSASHWLARKDYVIGKDRDKNSYIDNGKNPLHILCLRSDFEKDDCDFSSEMSRMLVHFLLDVNDMYLGHTPLSLAVLTGNLKLIKALLYTEEMDPYKTLEYDMGNVLTIHFLKRYADIMPLEKIIPIITLLVEKGINPLNEIGEYENAITFIEQELLEEKPALSPDDKNKSKKGTKPKKEKVTSKKSNKAKTSQDLLFEVLQNLTRKTIIEHIKWKTVKDLYNLSQENMLDDPLVISLAELLTLAEVLEYLQSYFQTGKLQQEIFSHEACVRLLNFVREHQKVGKTKKGKKGDKPKEKSKKGAKSKTSSESEIPYVPTSEDILDGYNFKRIRTGYKTKIKLHPQGREAASKYKVCFNCLRNRGKTLYLCPKCQQIYFCSEQCNKTSKQRKGLHTCGVLFYNKQKQEDKRLEELGETVVQRYPLFELIERASQLSQLRLMLEKKRLKELKKIKFERSMKTDQYGIRLGRKETKFRSPRSLLPKKGSSCQLKFQRFSRVVSVKSISSRISIYDKSLTEIKKSDAYLSGSKYSGLFRVFSEEYGLLSTKKSGTASKSRSRSILKSEPALPGSAEELSAEKTAYYKKKYECVLPKRKRKGKPKSLRSGTGEPSTAQKMAPKRFSRRSSRSRSSTRKEKIKFSRKTFTIKPNSRSKPRSPKGKVSEMFYFFTPTPTESSSSTSSKTNLRKCNKNIQTGQGVVKFKEKKTVAPKAEEEKAKEVKKLEDFVPNIVIKQSGPVIQKSKKPPKKYQYFMELLNKYFPDIDLSFMFYPYACCTDGQLYYRLNGELFGHTYSAV